MTDFDEERRRNWLDGRFESIGALKTHGHFVLKSGFHSVSYIDKDTFTYDPVLLDQMASFLVFQNHEYWSEVSLVVSPAVGAILFGGMVAHHLGCNFAFTEKDPDGNQFFRPSFLDKLRIRPKVLIVEDVVTRGTTIKQIADLLNQLGFVDLKYACIWDRTTVPVPVPWLRSVVSGSLPVWTEEDCIFCLEGRPINIVLGHGREFLDKYGSLPINWPANKKRNSTTE